MSRWHILECALWCALLIYGLDKVFTLRFFWLLHFPLSTHQNRKGCFPDVSSERTYSLMRFCIILGVFKKFIHQFIHFQFHQFSPNFILGKAELSVASCEIINVLESKAIKCQPNSQRRQMICHKPIKFGYNSTSQQFVEPVTSIWKNRN